MLVFRLVALSDDDHPRLLIPVHDFHGAFFLKSCFVTTVCFVSINWISRIVMQTECFSSRVCDFLCIFVFHSIAYSVLQLIDWKFLSYYFNNRSKMS